MSDDALFEKNYDELLRILHDKPKYRKPALGKMPEWLNDESVDFSAVRRHLKQVQHYDGKNENKIQYNIKNFCVEYSAALLLLAPIKDENFDRNLLAQIDNAKPLRDLFFDYVDALIACDLDVGKILGDFFEQLYNATFYVQEGKRSYNDNELEFSRFIVWEMFIGATAYFIHFEKYNDLFELLYRTYFLAENPLNATTKSHTFVKFRPYFKYIDEHIKPNSDKPNNFTLAGDIAVKREKRPIITQKSLANADVVLYQLSCVYEFSGNIYHHYWFPILYCYHDSYSKQSIWNQMVSIRHCQKLFPLLGVKSIEELKKIAEKGKNDKDIRYPRCYDSAPSIRNSIKIEEIGTMP
ncbi:MAG: hypothetical protein GX802_02625 [Clostridiales bacterium]|jgi:hypothetical protein|nr:hypothetical protein [Clostridiales bacterium]